MFVKVFLFFLCSPALLLLLSFLRHQESAQLSKCNELTLACIEKYYAYYWAPKLSLQFQTLRLKKNLLQMHTFGNVYFAKDEWLFYVSKNDGRPLDDYLGLPLPKDVSQQWINYIEKNFENPGLLRKKTPFFMIFAPNKSTFYHQKILHYPFRAEDKAPHLKIFTSLKSKPYSKNIIFPEQITNTFKDSSHLYYLRTDTHWNLLGAAKAYNLIAKNNSLPEIKTHLFTRTSKPASDGDLVKMLNTKNKDFLKRISQDIYLPPSCHSSECHPVDKTVLVIGDSFRHGIARILRTQYKHVYQVSITDLKKNKKKYINLNADLIFQVYVERYLRSSPSEFK